MQQKTVSQNHHVCKPLMTKMATLNEIVMREYDMVLIRKQWESDESKKA